VVTMFLIALGAGGCGLSRGDSSFAKMDEDDITGSLGEQPGKPLPTESDLAFARNAASDVLTRGDKDSDRRTRLSHPPCWSLLVARPRLPRFPGKLCQWPDRKLAPGGGLPVRARALGYSHAEAMEG
jgi:hypothetical protein